MSETSTGESIFAPHPKFGKYLSHHPSRRIAMVIIGGAVYGVAGGIVQLLFWNVPDDVAAIFLPMVFAVIAGAILWYILHLWNREIVLYETGFTYREGSRVASIAYEAIVRVRQNIEGIAGLGTLYDYRMLTRDEEIIRVNNLYSDTVQLINRLDALISRQQSQQVRQQLDDGQAVWFGDQLKASREGLEHAGQAIFWHEISGYRVQDGTLIIQTQADPAWAQVAVTEIDNVVVFIALLKQRSSARTAKGQARA